MYTHSTVYTKVSDPIVTGTTVYDGAFNAVTRIDNASVIAPLACIGTTSNYWPTAYINELHYNSGGINTSDRNLKHDISYDYSNYETFYDDLKPALFKYNDGTSNRLHVGFIAQDVEDSLKKNNISSNNFGGLVIENYLDEDKSTHKYGLRYEEFIALNVDQIQKLKNRILNLEKTVEKLKKGE